MSGNLLCGYIQYFVDSILYSHYSLKITGTARLIFCLKAENIFNGKCRLK